MANTMTKLGSFTVPTNGQTASIVFSSIPQTYTDLLVIVSARDTGSNGSAVAGGISFNGSTGNLYTNTVLRYGPSSFRSGGLGSAYSYMTGGGLTANNFASTTHYIPSYTTSTYKQIITDSFAESNTATFDSANISVASLAQIAAPITSISITYGQSGFALNTEVTLYGI